jgi:orotidine-5'-phosphate decarboxylase
MMFSEINHKKGHPVCVGIDPRILPVGHFFNDELNKHGQIFFLEKISNALIAAAAQDNGVVKIQSAFFEMHGSKGFSCLERLVANGKEKNVHVLLDAKRGDISSTMHAYGVAAFDHLNVDSLTVTPYMGIDVLKAIEPWLKLGKFAYVVLWSSNPSSSDVQERKSVDGKPIFLSLFERIQSYLVNAKLTERVGFVVGATNPYSEFINSDLGGYSWLMPGVGAQGAEVDERFKKMLADNHQHVIPISRGISGFGLKEHSQRLSEIKSWEEYEHFVSEQYCSYAELLSY